MCVYCCFCYCKRERVKKECMFSSIEAYLFLRKKIIYENKWNEYILKKYNKSNNKLKFLDEVTRQKPKRATIKAEELINKYKHVI